MIIIYFEITCSFFVLRFQEGLVFLIKHGTLPIHLQISSLSDFNAVIYVESALLKETGRLVQPSGQELVDCSLTNSGCNGGKSNLFNFLV